jgi:hypothetical protein
MSTPLGSTPSPITQLAAPSAPPAAPAAPAAPATPPAFPGGVPNINFGCAADTPQFSGVRFGNDTDGADAAGGGSDDAAAAGAFKQASGADGASEADATDTTKGTSETDAPTSSQEGEKEKRGFLKSIGHGIKVVVLAPFKLIGKILTGTWNLISKPFRKDKAEQTQQEELPVQDSAGQDGSKPDEESAA